MRLEEDWLGSLELPDEALYGLQTERARINFDLGSPPVNKRLVLAVVKVKLAAALTYQKLDPGRAPVHEAIAAACRRVLAGEAGDMFIAPSLQGGAGTSTNMNVNEVLANLALKILGRPCGRYDIVSPLDDVNRGQSTNDVYPTALRIAAIELLRSLSQGCANLQECLQTRENEFAGVRKLGRTELMDAVPVTLGEEFGAYAQAVARDRWRIYKIEERLRQVNIGGTAVGLSDNALRRYRFGVVEKLRELTDIGLAAAEYPMDITQNNDVFVEVSGLLKSLAVNLMKIANDLRLMNSGPRGGLGEIRLPARQMGSTIMPGKVNPVIPEMVVEVAIKVMANDLAVTLAASQGEFELNAFTPVVAEALLESLALLDRTVVVFQNYCLRDLEPNSERCAKLLADSLAFAASYAPELGHETVSEVIRERDGRPGEVRAALEALLAQKKQK
ncbi:MAG: aspartate ammonia-lyase [Deltaproteobacteria bacterium]|jgi:aspartate ammonia-lyase|nr:aspartate ammonia-lyase [Deltaproteobacteria bacterium]